MRCVWTSVVVLLGCSAAIEHGLDEPAANEVVTALDRAGIVASKHRDESGSDGFDVSVSKADGVRSMELLHSLGLPRGRRAGFGELYKQTSLLPTPTEERARYLEALSSEIAKTLETVEGVAHARVHLVLPEPDPLAMDGKPRVAAQAAILLKTHAGRGQPISELEVRKLVSGSVPGLDPAAVGVVFTAAAAAAQAPAQTAGLVSLGPLRMTPGSRPILIVAFAVGSGLLGLLAVLVLLMARRVAAAQGKNS
jgi:type III secretion protein J